MKTRTVISRLMAGMVISTILLGLAGCGDAGKVGAPEGAPRQTPPANGVLPPK